MQKIDKERDVGLFAVEEDVVTWTSREALLHLKRYMSKVLQRKRNKYNTEE